MKYIAIFLIAIITIFAFYPSLHNGFTNWDDEDYVAENKDISSISWKNIKLFFTSSYVGMYLPVTMITYSIEYYFFKDNPLIYHLTNLIFHIFNSLLVFWIIFIISRNIFSSFLCAIFFAIHPFHVESVAWISERKDVLSSFFIFVTIILYLYYKKTDCKKYYYLSLIMFTVSLMAKPMGITIPFILILFDYIMDGKSGNNNRNLNSPCPEGIQASLLQIYFNIKHLLYPYIIKNMNKIPFLLLSIIFIIISVHTQGSALKSYNNLTWIDNCFVASYGLIFYLTKLIAPFNLSAFYPYPEKINNILPVKFLLSPIIVMALLFLLFSIRKNKKLIFGSLFFLITIAPVIKLVPLSTAMAADRYTYIPSIGIFYLAGELFYFLYEHKKDYRKIILISLIGIIGVLTILTMERCKVWKDSITLWNDVMKNYPCATPYVNLSKEYIRFGEYEKAKGYIKEGLKYKPVVPELYYNLGLISVYEKKYDHAIDYFTEAIKIHLFYGNAYNNRGNVYYTIGQYDRAVFDYLRAIYIKPREPDNYNNMGLAYMAKGYYSIAIDNYTKALEIDENYIMGYKNRGSVFMKIKQYDRAIDDFKRVIFISPGDVEAYYNLSIIYYHMGEYDKSWEYVRKINSLDYDVEPAFLEKLKKASKR